MQALSFAVLSILAAGVYTMPVNPDDEYPWLNSGAFEGDIILRPEQMNRNGIIDVTRHWPNATMYYTIDPAFSDNATSLIRKAIDEFHTRTCVRLEERTHQPNYVAIVSSTDTTCSSEVGMVGGAQPLTLGARCFNPGTGTVVHELMHAFGFWHQQSAHDRDEYVDVLFENIADGKEHNFQKYSSEEESDHGFGYDYGSIMHYPRIAFSKNGQPTIVPKDPKAEIGQRSGLSFRDIKKLEEMYKCY